MTNESLNRYLDAFTRLAMRMIAEARENGENISRIKFVTQPIESNIGRPELSVWYGPEEHYKKEIIQ